MKPHPKPAAEVSKWSSLLVEAVNKPGLIMEAYSAFHNYSIGNQILALVQCQGRGLAPGPINTFPGWQTLGRSVKRGERALILCMPITRTVRDEESQNSEGESHERTLTTFVHKPRWFVLSQTSALYCNIHELIAELEERIENGETIDNPKLTRIAERHFDGTRAEGRYTSRDAYDALEIAVNNCLLEKHAPDQEILTRDAGAKA